MVDREIQHGDSGRSSMKTTGYDRQAQLFAALAHPVRLRMLEVLAEGEACVCHLCAALKQRQAYISQQLARLKEAGLITDTRDGLFVYYRLADPEVVRLLEDARRATAAGHGEPVAGKRLAAPNCPCPRCRAARQVSRQDGAGEARPGEKRSGGKGQE